MHGRNVTIAFDKKIIGLDYQTMSNYTQFIFNVWNYYWNIFEGFAYHNYTVIWLNGSVRGGGGQGTGMEMQYTYDDCSLCKPWCRSYSAAAHEVFHAWNNAREGGLNPP